MSAEERFHEHHQRLINEFKERRDSALVQPETSGAACVEFLRKNILPHAQAEEEVLYVEIDHRAGSDMATKSMRFEHDVLSGLIDEMDEFLEKPESFQHTLEQFSHLLLNHFEKEEAVLIPYLGKQLSEDDFLDILHEIHSEEEERKAVGS